MRIDLVTRALPGILPGLVMACLLLAAAAPAAAQTWTGAGTADDLRYRLQVIDAELADIRARLGMAAPSGGSSSGGVTGPGTVSADVMLRLDRLEAELRQLTGKIEQMEFSQRAVAEDAARRFGDIEFRLTELEGGDVGNLPPIQPLGGGTGGTPASTGPAVSISEQADLDRAIEDVNQGRFDLGEDRLRTFLTTYPGSPLTGEAHYWLGESQFVRGAFQNAAQSYLSGYKSDPVAPSGARNLYRLGVTLGRLGQLNEACLTLREVGRQYPTAPAEVLDAAASEASALSCG